MATWGLIRETTNVKHWDSYITETHVLAYVEGTYEEALAELELHARRLMAHHPKKRKRRRRRCVRKAADRSRSRPRMLSPARTVIAPP